MTADPYEMTSLPVRLHPDDLDALIKGQGKKRKRRVLRTNTFILNSVNPVEAVLPQANNRVEAWITSAIGASPPVVFISTSQAGANAQGGGAAQINGTDTTPFPVNTTDQVWATAAAASFPVTLSVVAIYEEDE